MDAGCDDEMMAADADDEETTVGDVLLVLPFADGAAVVAGADTTVGLADEIDGSTTTSEGTTEAVCDDKNTLEPVAIGRPE